MERIIRRFAGTFILISVLLALTACHRPTKSDHAASPAPIHAALLTVATREVPVTEQVVGTIQPKLQATVSAKVTGRVMQMLAVPGQTVAKDDLLAEIEAPQLRAALDQATAALTNARAEADRFRGLGSSGAVAKRDIDRAETTLRIAEAEHERLASALADATVKAPFAGRVTRKLADTGDLVPPGTPLCRIEDPTALRIEIDVAESLAQGLTIGQKFPLHFDSAKLDLTGTAAEISPAADPASRTFLVKLDLPAAKGLQAGQFGRAMLPRGTKTAILVPAAALLSRGQLVYVAVVGPDHLARLRIVRTGAATPDGVEILAGLEAGETITSPLPAGFTDGSPVTPQP